jgi:predicted helicase
VSARFFELLDRLDPDENKRGREFELICRWFLRNAPAYRSVLREVWLWDEWPDRWAVQAKCYDQDYSVKKRDVDSFLSESNRTLPGGRGFVFRLLLATTDGLGRTAQAAMASQAIKTDWLLRSQLAVEQVEWPTSPADLTPVVPVGKRPHPHQREAIDAVIAGLEAADRGQLIMACGTGKTLVGLWIAEETTSERVCVVVPSLSLLSQTLREWTANATSPLRYLAVCSDETVASAYDLAATTSELGVPVTTDPNKIRAFLRDDRHAGLRVVFCTYQSTPQLAEAHAHGAPGFDLLFADEAHRCTGPKAGVFATVLDQEKIPATKRVFMTATPRVFTDRVKKEAEESDFEVASMDDEERFGPVLHKLTFGQAIERQLLSDYRVVIVGVTDSLYREYAETGTFVTLDGESVIDARMLASQLGLLRAMHKYDLHRVVSFHSRVSNASAFANSITQVRDWLPEPRRPSGELWTQHVSGKMTSGQRDRHLNHLRELEPDERGLLSNARCLGEGVDVPTLDEITDPEIAIADSAFQPIWDILKALRTHDDILAAELDEIRRELGRRTTTAHRPAKIVLDIPTTIAADFVSAFDAQLVEQTTTTWEFWFGLLERYAEREGHTRVPSTYRSEDGARLGTWVTRQRQYYRRGDLGSERTRRLEVFPDWTWLAGIRPAKSRTPRATTTWEEWFAKLERYAEREGHTRVPNTYCSEDGARLGEWGRNQRHLYRRGDLDPERTRRLEAFPDWTWTSKVRPGMTATWDEWFAKLERHIEEHGTARVPAKHVTSDGYKLGSWVTRQRRAYKKEKGDLSPERVERLESLEGWTWTAREST